MKSISEPFINRPVMTILLYLAVAAFGIYSYVSMPVSDLPTVDYPIIRVTCSYPGASPDVMAHNVASPLEQQFLKIPGIELVASNNSVGFSSITLQFQLDKSIDGAAADVQAAISAATGSLPQDLPAPPSFEKVNPNEQPVIYCGMISYQMTESDLYDYAVTNVAQRIQTVPGVAGVQVYGSPRAVRIEVDPRKLYARGLTFNDINTAIRQSTTLQSAGLIKGGNIQLTVKPQTQLEHAADYANLIIAYKNGTPVFLHDIADCIDSLQSEDMKLAYVARGIKPGSVGVVLAVSKAAGANNVEVAQGVIKLLPTVMASMPPSIKIIPIYNRAVSIENSVRDVTSTLLIAFVLVVLVVFLFLGRARDTLIPAFALPMSLLLTFIVMHACGYTLDNLSLMALTLSIGFLIDDAIVFLENMVRRMEAGEKVWVAVYAGAKEISFTILAMTLSLASVFIPLVGMGGMMGRVFREFGVTIIVSIFASGIVSLTLTPMMCSRVLAEYNKDARTWLERVAHAVEDRILRLYSPALTFALKHWYFSVIAYFACFFGAFWFYEAVPKSFLPVGDSSFIFGVWIVNTDTSPARMQQIQDNVIQAISKNPYVLGFVTVSGFSARLNSNQGIAFVALEDPKLRPPIAAVNNQILGEMAKIPGVIPALRPRPNLQISAGVVSNFQGGNAYILYGLDKDKVYNSALQLMGAMRGSGLFKMVNSDYYADNRQLEVNVNRQQASNYGVNATPLAQTIASAYAQNYSYLIKSEYQQYWVVVEAAKDFRTRPSSLGDVYFSAVNSSPLFQAPDLVNQVETQKLVPFRTVASSNVTLGPLAVNHFNNFTSVTIFFDTNPNVSIGTATDFVDNAAKKLVPAGVTGGFQGDALVFRQTVVQMGLMFIVALFVMYIILGILYESYIHPITVLLSIPPAVVGGFGALYLANLAAPDRGWGELSLYGMIGMFMLAGIVKKNAIMMIDFAIIRQAEGRTPLDAVHEACMERFRPILMTTCAAFFGALPLAVGYGADAASRIPLGLAICGGLVVSQIVTLFVTPVTYLGFEWFQVHVLDHLPFFARRKDDQPAAPTPPAQPQHQTT